VKKLAAFRLTFLWRFTLITLAVSTVAALVLAVALENAHRRVIENDIISAAVGRANAELAQPLDAAGPGATLSPATRRAFAAAARDASFSEYVSALRVYRASGAALYPPGAAAAPGPVHAALAADDIIRRDEGAALAAYTPIFTNGEHAYVIAVDFPKDQLAAHFHDEAANVVRIVAGVVAVIFLSLVMLAAGASRELERRRRESSQAFTAALEVMAETIDLRDPYTAGHSKRVAVYSRKLAEAAGLGESAVESIEGGALLHDIGKIAIPDRVLFKPAKLDPDERAIIESHPAVGADLLANVPAMEDVTRCVLHHHERLDGRGYPHGLRGEDIPFGARVIAVADTFDAMTTDRPYRRALTVERAVDELRRVAGTQLDAGLVETFVGLIGSGKVVLLQAPAHPDDEAPVFGRKVELAVRR
jgi:putative nucleotidyltransferase with HDIG domain